MKKILKTSIISIVLSTMISIPVFAKSGKVVNTDEVRFREKASATEDSKVLDELAEGTIVEILDKTKGWYKVEYEGTVGYINANYLEEVEQTEQDTSNIIQDSSEDLENNENTQNIESIDTNAQIVYKTTEKVDVKLMPLINSTNIFSLDKNKICNIVTTAGNWVYIENGSIKGWILKQKIGESKTTSSGTTEVRETTTLYTSSKKGYVNLDSINVRREPTTASELVAKLTLNTEVTILGEDGNWYYVELNGENLYILKDLLSDSKITTTSRSSEYTRTETANLIQETTTTEQPVPTTGVTGADVAAYAKQFLGYPYVYATAGPDSFDCSGFTSYVYKHFGYNISRSSSAQQYEGVNVSKENLQPGDIIIFLNTAKTAVGHVGIYIGNNQFIHASSSTTGVIISDLDSANYPQRYVTARRILN